MYLFSRSSRLATGNLVESLSWATRMTEKVNTLSDVAASLWTNVYSPSIATLTWIAMVDDLAQLEALNEKSMTDPAYVALVQEGAMYSAGDPVDDALMRMVHQDPAAASADASYASVVNAVVASGNTVAAMELGVEIAQRATSITGRPTSFGSAVTGTYGGVGWFALYESIAQVQEASEALAQDADFAALLDKKAGQAYLPGASTQTLHRKIL